AFSAQVKSDSQPASSAASIHRWSVAPPRELTNLIENFTPSSPASRCSRKEGVAVSVAWR
ncbi:MAG: hypothetical protein AAFR83_25465, partial [Cyanobacteria bacterium J06629_18]